MKNNSRQSYVKRICEHAFFHRMPWTWDTVAFGTIDDSLISDAEYMARRRLYTIYLNLFSIPGYLELVRCTMPVRSLSDGFSDLFLYGLYVILQSQINALFNTKRKYCYVCIKDFSSPSIPGIRYVL